MRRSLSLVSWFAALFVVWEVLSGTIQSTELYAGLAAAAVGAVVAEILRARGLLDFTADPAGFAKIWRAPGLILLDVAVVTLELARAAAARRRVTGTWVVVEYPQRPGAAGRWQRMWGVVLANGYANSVVVDYGDDDATMHVLRRDVVTGRSVL